MENSDSVWQGRAARLFCILVVTSAAVIVLKYASFAVFVMLASLLIAFAVNGIASFLASRTHLPKRSCAAVTVILIFTVFLVGTVFAVSKLFRECERFVLWMSENRDIIYAHALELVYRLRSYLPFLDELPEGSELVRSFINGVAATVLKLLTAFLGGALNFTPTVFLSAMGFFIFCFYLSVDLDRLLTWIGDVFPKGCIRYIDLFRSAAIQYLRAYVLIFFITFFEIFAGLTALRFPYAFLISLAVAVVDILPVLGSGAVLLPWAGILVLLGDVRSGTGILILYGAVTVIRQLIEPYIIGGRMGIHPLLSFSLMLFGISFFGVGGAIICPFIGVILKELFLAKTKKCIYKNKNMLFTNRENKCTIVDVNKTAKAEKRRN